MANKTYAKEWLGFALKNLETAQLLNKVNHYEDIIGIEIQQSLEKLFKSVMAYENIKIPKDNDLIKLYFIIENYIHLKDNELIYLRLATDYYKEDRYPNPNYTLPTRDEIKEILDFSQNLFDEVFTLLDLKKEEIK